MPVRLYQPIQHPVFWALAITFFLYIQSIAQAAQVTIAWDFNDPAPDGYRVFQRVEGQSYDYSSPVSPQAGDDPTQTTSTITGLADDTSYYFVVRAYVGSDESGDSNEINFVTGIAEPTAYTITTSAGPNGNISPDSATVNAGGNQTFSISPSAGYHIEDVHVDGISAGVHSSYTFSEISADHVIEVIFAADQLSDTSDPGNGDADDQGIDDSINSNTDDTITSIIIDDGESGTSSTGNWSVSSGTDPFGGQSLYSKEVGADYVFQSQLTGSHEVAMWWSGYRSRCTNVPVEIYNGNELIDTINVDQSQNSGQWNVLGSYDFSGDARIYIVSDSSECSTSADGIRFVVDDDPIVIDNVNNEPKVIDDGDTGTSSTGIWSVSSGTDPFGAQSLYSRQVGAEYTYASQVSGFHEVALWWSGWSSRCSDVPVEIYDGDMLLDRIYVDQSQDSGQWNVLGSYDFNGDARVAIISDSSECSTSADALIFSK